MRVRVGVGISVPSQNPYPGQGSRVCMRRKISVYITYFCPKYPSFLFTKNIFSMYQSILHGYEGLLIQLYYLTYRKK
jgi:hypothetical protein